MPHSLTFPVFDFARFPAFGLRHLRVFAAVLGACALAGAGRGVEVKEGDMHGWRLLSPLPDPTGYGGMFAGVLEGRLVAGGGTQWDKPIWKEGSKVFSKRIFILETLESAWKEHAVTLPVESGHFATASTASAIYLVGGISGEVCLRSVWEIKAAGDGFTFRSLPELPRPIGYGAAAIARGRLYVVGGVEDPAARSAHKEVWSLALDPTESLEGWRREADLPGTGVFVNMAASDGSDVFVFGGMAFDAEQGYRPSRDAHRLDTATGRWVRLPDLPEPRVGPTGFGQPMPDGRIFVIGGYKEVFPGAMRDHPSFSPQTYLYDIEGGRWEQGPLIPVSKVLDRDSPGDPGPSPMIGAMGVIWRDHVVVLSGEVRASVRSPAVLAWPLKRSGSDTPSLP